MARSSPADLQTRRDIRRAEVLLGLVDGLTGAERAEALRHRAAAEGISRHAAALAVLSTGHADDPSYRRPARAGRHLSAVTSSPPRHDP